MILLDLTIRGFGKFQDKKLSFSNGINVIYGSNEAGKSTVHSFIRAMLYGMERARGRASKTDFWSHFEPWQNSGVYGGIMRVKKDAAVYRIERNFARNPKDVTVVNETAGTAVTDTAAFFEELLSGMSETAYCNTVSIGQLKSATDSGMVSELKNYIANMNTTGNMALNITKASAFLRDQRKSFVSRLVPEAAKSYASNLSEIKQIEAGIASPEYKNTINALKEEKAGNEKEQQQLQAQREKLIGKIAAEKQQLKENRFENRDQILSYRKEADDCYAAYEEAKKKDVKKGCRVMTVVLLVLAALSLASAAYLYILGPQNLLCAVTGLPWKLTLVISCAAAGILFILVLILGAAVASVKRRLRTAREDFLSLSREHLRDMRDAAGEDADCDTVKNCLKEQTDACLDLCGSIDADELELKKTADAIALLDGRQAAASDDIEKQQKSQWELEQQLEHLVNLKDEAAALKNVIAENDRLQFEIDAIDLAQETMTRLSTSIRDSFGLYLNKEASDLIGGITGGIYSSLSIDENLNVFLNTEEKLVPLEQVSSGTMDQVYLALRLAAANLMMKNGEPLPLLFDDSFVNYDEDRLRTALRWLSTVSDRQSLVFTCHRREAQLLSANMIDYSLTEI